MYFNVYVFVHKCLTDTNQKSKNSCVTPEDDDDFLPEIKKMKKDKKKKARKRGKANIRTSLYESVKHIKRCKFRNIFTMF